MTQNDNNKKEILIKLKDHRLIDHDQKFSSQNKKGTIQMIPRERATATATLSFYQGKKFCHKLKYYNFHIPAS